MARGVGFYNQPWFSIKIDKGLVYESIIRILMTSPGERVMRPSFGSGIKGQLFETLTADVLQDLATRIHSDLESYERRINVVDVQTEISDDNILRIHIFMTTNEQPDETQEITLRYNLEI